MSSDGFAPLSLSKLLFQAARKKMGARWLHQAAARERRRELSRELGATLGRAVLAGPFAGMILPEEASWRDGDFLPKLIGSYEADLRATWQVALERRPTHVINVGSAEGYYAVGLARLLPAATVHAFDLDPRACAVCARAAAENQVAERVRLGGRLTVEGLGKLLELTGRCLLVLDCEGAERDLLDPARAPGLAACDMVVECHGAAITAELKARLQATHAVQEIVQGGRDPHELPALRGLAESDRWLLVDEGRPEAMTWLACWAQPNAPIR
jgi:hypothetical protein